MFLRTRAEPFVRQFGTLPTAAALVGLLLMSMGNFIVFFLLLLLLLTPSYKQIQNAHWQKAYRPHRTVAMSLAHRRSLTRTHAHTLTRALTLELQIAKWSHLKMSIYLFTSFLKHGLNNYNSNNNNIQLHFFLIIELYTT